MQQQLALPALLMPQHLVGRLLHLGLPVSVQQATVAPLVAPVHVSNNSLHFGSHLSFEMKLHKMFLQKSLVHRWQLLQIALGSHVTTPTVVSVCLNVWLAMLFPEATPCGHVERQELGLVKTWSAQVCRNFINITAIERKDVYKKSCIAAACPVNSYKASASQCSACPNNTETRGSGNEKTGCVCKAGWMGPPGGPCTGKPH